MNEYDCNCDGYRFRAGGFLALAAEELKESAIDCCPARRPRPPAARRLPPRVTELPDAPVHHN